MIDVGQGDAFLLTLGGERGDFNVLIDGGPPNEGAKVAKFINENASGGRVDFLIVTHLDVDHIGGLNDVVNQCDVRRFFMNVPGQSRESLRKVLRRKLYEGHTAGASGEVLKKSLQAATDLVAALQARNLSPEPILAGRAWMYGDVTLSVLNPTQARLGASWADILVDEDEKTSLQKALTRAAAVDTSPENNSSVVIELLHKDQPYALLTGDAGADVLREVTAGHSYKFLKVSHHGSKTGLDAQLAAQLGVSTAYIPVGSNPHGHPDREVLDLLHRTGAKTYCSQRTDNCRRDCPLGGFGTLCHRVEREFRPGWTTVDPNKCANNQ